MLKKVFVFLVLLGVCSCQKTSSNCVLQTDKLTFFAPLIFNEDGSLVPSIVNSLSNSIILESGKEVVLSCAPNFFKLRHKDQVIHAKCVGDTTLSINNQNTPFDQLGCELRSVEEILINIRDCNPPHRSVQYGITNPINQKSYVLGESCYSTTEGRTIFAHTKLRSNGTKVTDLALSVEDEHHFKQSHPSYHYRIQFLKAVNVFTLRNRLENLLGDNADDIRITTKKFIDLNYLTDKQLHTVRKFTWNEFPAYNYHENNNLEILKKDVLGLGVFELEIYTGTHGVLEVLDKDNKKIKLYLLDDKFPVPNYIWTIVKSSDRATAFIYVNNPKLTDIQSISVCNSKCSKISWITNLLANEQYKKMEDGYMLCCDVSDIKTTFTEIPDLIEVIGLFV